MRSLTNAPRTQPNQSLRAGTLHDSNPAFNFLNHSR